MLKNKIKIGFMYNYSSWEGVILMEEMKFNFLDLWQFEGFHPMTVSPLDSSRDSALAPGHEISECFKILEIYEILKVLETLGVLEMLGIRKTEEVLGIGGNGVMRGSGGILGVGEFEECLKVMEFM